MSWQLDEIKAQYDLDEDVVPHVRWLIAEVEDLTVRLDEAVRLLRGHQEVTQALVDKYEPHEITHPNG